MFEYLLSIKHKIAYITLCLSVFSLYIFSKIPVNLLPKSLEHQYVLKLNNSTFYTKEYIEKIDKILLNICIQKKICNNVLTYGEGNNLISLISPKNMKQDNFKTLREEINESFNNEDVVENINLIKMDSSSVVSFEIVIINKFDDKNFIYKNLFNEIILFFDKIEGVSFIDTSNLFSNKSYINFNLWSFFNFGLNFQENIKNLQSVLYGSKQINEKIKLDCLGCNNNIYWQFTNSFNKEKISLLNYVNTLVQSDVNTLWNGNKAYNIKIYTHNGIDLIEI